MNLRELYLRKKFWLNDFMHGGLMWKAFKEICYINNNAIEEGKLLRDKRLREILSFAKSHTAFYSRVKGDSLSDFPVINKQMILANREDFLVPENEIPGQVGKLHVQSTSGSSGIPFSLPQDTLCRIRRVAMIKYGNELIGFHSFARMMHLRSFKHYWGGAKKGTEFNKKLNIIYADNSDLTLSKIQDLCNIINRDKVKFVRGYMTTLESIAQFALDHNISFPLHPTFISVGEMLSERLRQNIIKLQCSIISQYGNEENGIFGQTELNGEGSTMRLNLANCYMEILKFDKDEPVEKGELGRIVVTDLTNYAMPMIRYDIGDVATIGEVKNGVMLSIEKLSGRKTDMISRTDGSLFDLYNSLPADINNSDKIKQYQFIQKGRKTYLMKLNVASDEVKEQTHHFTDLLKEVLGQDAEIIIEYVDEIPVLSSGKRKVVINEWKDNK